MTNLNFDAKLFRDFELQIGIENLKTNSPVSIQEHGFLGNLDTGDYKLTMCIHSHTLAHNTFFAYSISKEMSVIEWNVKVLSITNPKEKIEGCTKGNLYENCYEKIVRVFEKKGNRTTNYVQYPANGFRIVRIGNDGRVTIYDLSIFMQDGKFWFSSGLKYDFHVSKNDGNYYLTNNDLRSGAQWAQLRRIIIEKASTTPGITIQENLPAAEDAKLDLKPGELSISWFNPTYGKGACKINNNGMIVSASIHYSRIKRPVDPKIPRVPADGFIYEVVGSPIVKKPDSNKSSFEFEIAGMIDVAQAIL